MGWTWLEGTAFEEAFKGFDDEAREAEMERRSPLIDEVAQQLSALRESREQDHFYRQAYLEETGYAPDEPEFEDQAEQDLYELRREIARKKEEDEEEALKAKLAELGARMTRPYEHWNEDEKRMEYLERDR